VKKQLTPDPRLIEHNVGNNKLEAKPALNYLFIVSAERPYHTMSLQEPVKLSLSVNSFGSDSIFFGEQEVVYSSQLIADVGGRGKGYCKLFTVYC
jgi:hypothetical protein